MAAPTYRLPVTGSARPLTSRAAHEAAVQAVADALYAELGAIATGLRLAGNWDASSGAFPENATRGSYYLVSAAGTVDEQVFAVGDWLVPLVNDASTSSFAGQWARGEYSKVVKRVYEDVPALQASAEPARGVGAEWRDLGGHVCREVAPDSEDYLIRTSAGVKLQVAPGPLGLVVTAAGVDPTGAVACDAAFNAAFAYARSKNYGLALPPGRFRVAQGLDFIGSPTVSGFQIRMGIRGAGAQNTVFFSHGAPDYVLRIDARYFEASGFAITGSIDEIRDTAHSAKTGIWVENMRQGALTNFEVRHIVGAGLRIDRCIVSRIDGVVYRCGSDTARAVDQTIADQDGCQASWVKINCEDAQGAAGAMRFLSCRNTHLEAKLENQPYWIFEISAPVGNAAREASVTFSGGATGVVALTNTDPSNLINGNGQLTVKDLTGTVTVGETFTSSDGASGTVKAFTAANGPQFWAGGEYGTFDIYANQNILKADLTAGDITFACSDSHILKGQVRGPHVGYGVVISGARNEAQLLYVDQGLTDVAEEASRYDAVLFSAGSANNTVHTIRTRNAKGVDNAGSRNRIDQLDQTNLYGRSYRGQGNFGGVTYANVQQLEALAETSPVNLQGEGTFFGTGGGVIEAPAATGEVVLLAGARARLGPVQIPDMGAANYGLRLTGADALVQGAVIAVAAGRTGIQNVATRGRVLDCDISGGAKGVYARTAGCVIRGGSVSGYTSIGVHCDPAAAVTGMRVEGVSFHSAGAGASADIQFAAQVTKSFAINNSLATELGATGLVVPGSGSGNILTQNAA